MIEWQSSGEYEDIIYETAQGIAKVTIRVARIERRNTSRMMAAKVPPTQMFCRTSSIEDLM